MANVFFFGGPDSDTLYVTEDFPVMIVSDEGYCSHFDPVIRGGAGHQQGLVLTPARMGKPTRLAALDDDTFVILNSAYGAPTDDEVVRRVSEMREGATPTGFSLPGVAEVVANFNGRALDSGQPDASIRLPSQHLTESPRIAYEFTRRFPNCGKMGGGGPAGGNYPGVSDYPFIFTQLIADHAQQYKIPFVLDQSTHIAELQNRLSSGGGFRWNHPPEGARNLGIGRHVEVEGRAEYRLFKETWADREDDSLLMKAARMVPGFNVGIQREAELAVQEAGASSKAFRARAAEVIGQQDEAAVDLFESHDQLPEEIRGLVARYSDLLETGDIDRYKVCREFLVEAQAHGYTFEYGLDGEPYGLRVDDVDIENDLGPR